MTAIATRTPGFDRLLDVLRRLVACHEAWLDAARRHGKILVRQKTSELPQSLQELEAGLDCLMGLEEERIEAVEALARQLRFPVWDEAPKLSLLARKLPPDEARDLSDLAARLREVARRSGETARRNHGLAETGHRLATSLIRTVSERAVRRSRSPVAYGRTGAPNRGVAAPVFQRAWKA